jgi:hypothetical protein
MNTSWLDGKSSRFFIGRFGRKAGTRIPKMPNVSLQNMIVSKHLLNLLILAFYQGAKIAFFKI